jgi:signal peptidase I
MRRILIAFVALPFVVLGGLLSFGVVRIYRNPTASMEPTLPVGARFLTILTNKADRGDIVAFVYPLDTRVLFGKRVVAVGGDVVEIRDKRLFVNGNEVNEHYAVHADPIIYPNNKLLPEPYRSRDHLDPFRVPNGTFFVLGDNRDQSSDSRYWGTVPRKNIRGRVFLAFSWSRGFWRP